MTLQMNSAALMANGYKLVAMYEMFKRGARKFNVECWQGNGEYLVKHWNSGKQSYTHVYTSKEQANAKFAQLKSMYSFVRKIK